MHFSPPSNLSVTTQLISRKLMSGTKGQLMNSLPSMRRLAQTLNGKDEKDKWLIIASSGDTVLISIRPMFPSP